MKTFTVFNLDGLIYKTGSVFTDTDIDLQAQANETVVEGIFDVNLFYLLNNVVTAYTAEQTILKKTKPSPFHVWNQPLMQWVDSRSLDQHKTAKWEQIKIARAAAIDAPLATLYGTFDSYAEARSNITDAVLLAQTLAGMGQAVAIAYTLADNQVVTLDLTGMVTVGLMLGSKVQTVRGIATGLRTQIEAATTAIQLEAITWPA